MHVMKVAPCDAFASLTQVNLAGVSLTVSVPPQQVETLKTAFTKFAKSAVRRAGAKNESLSVLDNISAKFKSGSTTIIIGPPGAGQCDARLCSTPQVCTENGILCTCICMGIIISCMRSALRTHRNRSS